MFGSVRMSGRRLTAISLLCFVMFLGVCLLMLRAAPHDTVDIGGEAYPLGAESDDDIPRFISACGYEAVRLIYNERIVIPKTWNDTYSAYNELQTEQGFDLVPYKGKEARQVIYELGKDAGYAEVLVCSGRIIAAHLCGMEPDSKPEKIICRGGS